MVFYSLSFLVFFLMFSLIIHFMRNVKSQQVVFLIANIIFYGYWDYRFLVLLCVVITVCYQCAILYDKNKNDIWIILGTVFVLFLLGVFKYFDFFVSTFLVAFGIESYITFKIILPLGISFYLFQVLSYLFDVRKGKIETEKNYIKLAIYISFFPQIVSGPIVKAYDFLPQLDFLHKIKKKNLYEGLQLFLTGLTQKVVFADRIGVAVDSVYSAPAAYDSLSVLFAIIGYALQIYFDFSGYSDMAIGIAKIWDFDLGENFNAPYLAKNPSDFWKRWHISLSSWFKEYVYIPLGGNRKSKMRTYFNIFITMLLSGIWHGANITFIVWGMIHGLGSAINKLYHDLAGKKKSKSVVKETVCILLNCLFVSLAWVFFRTESISDAIIIIYRLFSFRSGIHYINVYMVCYALLAGFIFALSFYKNDGNIIKINMNLDKLLSKIILVIWIFSILMLMYCGNSAFIYARF